MGKQQNTFSFATVLFIILGLIVPFWPISLPLFWYLAYRSYRSGAAPPTTTSLADLQNAQALLDRGTISQDEFDRIKADILSR